MPFDPSQPFEVVEEPPSPTPTPVTHYSLGADVGGPDELQDKWTNRGYTSKGPNLTPGVVAVNPKIYPLGTILRDADTGEAFLATDTHGNKDPNVVDIYQPPDQYKGGSGIRNFVVAGRVKDIPKDPAGVQKLLAGYGKVPQGQSASDFLTGKKSGFDPSQPFEVVDEAQVGFDPSQPFEVVEPETAQFPNPVPTPEQNGQPINLPAKEPEVIEMGEFTPTPSPSPTAAPQAQGTPTVASNKNEQWRAMQADTTRRAEEAGLPSIQANPDESESRLRIMDAFARLKEDGIKVPHFMGREDEPEGDRPPTIDLENLVKGLKTQEARAKIHGNMDKLEKARKERAFWEQEIKANGMTAEEWKKGTGEGDPSPLSPEQQLARELQASGALPKGAGDNFDPNADIEGQVAAGLYGASKGSAMLAGGLGLAAASTGFNAGISAMTGPLAPATFALLNVGEFFIGSYLASKAHAAVEKSLDIAQPELSQKMRENVAAHPYVEQAGEMIPMAGLGASSVKNMVDLAKAQPTIQAAAKQIALRVTGGATAGAAEEPIRYGIDTATSNIEGAITGNKPEVSPITVDSVATSMAWGAIFSGMNQHNLSRAEVQEIVRNAPTEHLQTAASDPEFRKSWKYDSAWIDQELKRRANQSEILPPSPDPIVAATQAEIEAKANEMFKPRPVAPPAEGRPTTMQEQQTSPLDTITQLKGTPYAEAIAPFEGFLKGEGIEVGTSDRPTALKVDPETGKLSINLEIPKEGENPLVTKAKVEEEISHAATAVGFLREFNQLPNTTFKTAKGSTYDIFPDGTTRRNKAQRPEHGTDYGIKDKTVKTVYVDPEFAREVGMWQTSSSEGKRVRLIDGKVQLLSKNLKTGNLGIDPLVGNPSFSEAPQVGKSPLELFENAKDIPGAFKGTHPGNEIIEVGKSKSADQFVAEKFSKIGKDLRQTASSQEVQNIIDIYTKNAGAEMSDAALGAEFSRQVWQELQSGRTTEQVQILSKLSEKGDAQAGTLLRHLLDALMNFKETVSRYVDLEKAPQSLKDALETANRILDEYSPQEGFGAPPERFSPSDKSTSVKNAVVGEERIARGLPEREEPLRRSFGKVWDEAKAQVEADPTKGARLIEEMNKKPRPLSDTESAVLLNEKIKRDNEFDSAVDAVNNAKDGVEREDATRRLEAAREQVQRAYEATEVAGTKAAQALNARKILVDKEEFTLSRMEAVYRATANDGSPLSEKQVTQVKEAHDKIAELQKRVTELEEQARTKRINEYFNKLLTDTKKEVKQTAKQGVSLADFLDIQANKARERVAARRREGRFMTGLDPVDLVDHVIIGADYISKGVSKVADFTSRLVKDFGEEIRPYAQEIFDKSKQYQADLQKEQVKNAPKVPPAQKKIDQYTKAVETRTKKLEEKIKAGDYTRKTPEERILDAKAKKALYDYEAAKKRWNEGLHQAMLANRSLIRKVGDNVLQGLGFARAIQTGLGDISAVFNQGGFITFGAPLRAAKGIYPMLRAGATPYGQFKVMHEIENRGSYPLMKQAKLALTKEDGSLTKMEEAYMSRWIPPTPLKKGQPIRNVARGVKNVVTYPLAFSDRAYTTFLNKLRADSFDALSRSYHNGKPTLEEAKDISRFINTATGRPNFGKYDSPVWNTILFSPKFFVSRFQLLAGQPMISASSWKSRRVIATQYVKYAIGMSIVLGLLDKAGARIELDPRSADYGKAIIGNTRINLGSGLPAAITFLSRLFSGQTKNTKGKLVPLRDSYRPFDSSNAKVPFGGRDEWDVISSFARSKLAPVPQAGVSLATMTDAIGRPTSPSQIAQGMVTPMTGSDIVGALKDQNIPNVQWKLLIGLLSVMGASNNTYDTTAKP